jgi:hypothetical protein
MSDAVRSLCLRELLTHVVVIAWRGVETLEEQLEYYGVDLAALDDVQMEVMTECLYDENVQWKLFQAHADAVSVFARRQGLRAVD